MDLPHAWAYLPDLAEAFVELAARRHEIGTFECFNFEGHAMTGHELIAHIEAAEGRPLKRAGMPWILIRAGGIFKPLWREIGMMSYLWFAPHALAGRKFDALVGTQNRTPVREAVARAIRDLPQGHRAAA
jgi:nucleoside-diphosphate-sugar epimerase